MNYQRTSWELDLRSRLKDVIFPIEVLTSIALEVHIVYQILPQVYCFLICGEEVGLSEDDFIYAIYLKSPSKRHLYVSEESFKSKEMCRDEMVDRGKYFLLFGMASRFLF